MYSGIFEKIESVYEDEYIDISSHFKEVIKDSIIQKQDYLKFFGDSLEYTFDDKIAQKVAIKLSEKYPKFLEACKNLGIDEESIIKNNFRGKKVTAILQKEGYGRFDDVYSNYQKLNKNKIKISINPYEMVTASEKVSSNHQGDLRTSCYRIGGEYHSNVWSYITTPNCTILKIIDGENKTLFRMWVSFDLDNYSIMFGRHYGKISKSVYKFIRETLEHKLAKYFSIPNKWIYATKEVDIYCDYSDVFYFDSPVGVAYNTEKGNREVSITFKPPLNDTADEASSTRFAGEICENCGDICNETFYIEYRDVYICENCLQYYVWSNMHSEYLHENDVIYIEDLEDYDFKENKREYYEIDNEYYRDLPDDYVIDYDGDIEYIDDVFYDETAEYYYHINYYESIEIYKDNNLFTICKDNLPEDYIECEECGVYHQEDLEECPNCKYKLEEVA